MPHSDYQKLHTKNFIKDSDVTSSFFVSSIISNLEIYRKMEDRNGNVRVTYEASFFERLGLGYIMNVPSYVFMETLPPINY